MKTEIMENNQDNRDLMQLDSEGTLTIILRSVDGERLLNLRKAILLSIEEVGCGDMRLIFRSMLLYNGTMEFENDDDNGYIGFFIAERLVEETSAVMVPGRRLRGNQVRSWFRFRPSGTQKVRKSHGKRSRQ